MADDAHWMKRALRLAKRGEGCVEPNPMVGCVLVRDDRVLGEGWHERFGDAHAEVNAIASATEDIAGATAYVTLEPCCHQGKTPPCADALIDAGVAKVVIAHPDPFPKVDGGGIERLRDAGIIVEIGVLRKEAAEVLAPYLMLVGQQRPWVIAKWAMTLDGRIATRQLDSQWISNPLSRRVVHEIRGRVDGVLVGSGTAKHDNPRLTARPSGVRTATRIVLDGDARLDLNSNLAATATDVPVLMFANQGADPERIGCLSECGVEVIEVPQKSQVDRLEWMLGELGKRRMTNVLVEGGGTLLGKMHDRRLLDELHIFIAPKVIGGESAVSPIAGEGVSNINEATILSNRHVEILGDDIYIRGRVDRT